MKTKLERLEEDQVQQEEENISTIVEVFQTPAPLEDMLEVVDAFAACLDEFEGRGCRQCSKSEGE
jgi:hypothetical protein